MKIFSVNNYQSTMNQPSFGVNLCSPKLNFTKDDFYIRIKGYGKNNHWVEKIMETADIAVKFMRENWDFEFVLRYITSGVTKANQFTMDLEKRNHTGILRTERKNWRSGSDWGSCTIITGYDGKKSRYKIYNDRFNQIVKKPLKNPYKQFGLTRPVHDKDEGKFLEHPDEKYVNHALDMVSDLYKVLKERYIEKEAVKGDLDSINSIIAEIRWIMAHATPWERGSDAISNTFMRALYKAIGIKSYPLKRGVSLDLEAYCTNLNEYKQNFESYFYKKPEIID